MLDLLCEDFEFWAPYMVDRLTQATISQQAVAKQSSAKHSLRKKSFWCVVGCAAVIAAFSTPVKAEIYSCKDDSGRVITSDRPIAECSKREVRIIRSDGVTKGVIEAPLNDEQRKQRALDLEAKLAKQNQDREQQSKDRALIAAFADTPALELSRKRQLEELQVEIDAAKKRILIKHPDLITAQAELEFYRNKKPPASVTNKIQLAANAILVEDELIRSKRQEMVSVNTKYNADGKRLRELIDPVVGKLAQVIKH